MVEKLHKFSRWQKAKLAKRAGVVSEFFQRQLDAIMKKSVKVILKSTPKGESSRLQDMPFNMENSVTDGDNFDHEANVDALLNQMNQ